MLIEDINLGELIPILPGYTADHISVNAYYPALTYEHTRTQLFIKYLKNKLS